MEIIITALGVLVLAAVGIHFWQEKKRVEAIKTFSYQNGYQYEPELSLDLQTALSPFDLFKKGGGRKFSNALSRDSGTGKIWIFDYQYTTGTGKNRTTHQQTVLAQRSGKLKLPAFSCHPGGKWAAFFSGLFGAKDIPIESDPEFSKKFIVSGQDENAVRQLFMQSQIGGIMKREKDLCLQGSGDLFVFFRRSKRLHPNSFQGLIAIGEEIFSTLCR